MTAATKLAEAQFFLELLDALDDRSVSLTNDASCADEASFLLSAVLNSLYSSLEQAKPIAGVDAVVAHKSAHPLIFKGDGLRNVTVHERHVGADYAGLIRKPANAANIDLRHTPKLTKESEAARRPGYVSIVLGPDFYIELGGEMVEIRELCHAQYYALRKFLKEHGVVA